MTNYQEFKSQVDHVKRELPQVTVRWKGKTYIASTSGRSLDFARVALPDGVTFEYSWAAIARAHFQHLTLAA